jgi:MoxR-like ATPase
VLATQNPIEQEGTYSLPEAQVDRFMLKLVVRYPTAREERQILDRMAQTTTSHMVRAVLKPADIVAARNVVDRIFVDDRIKDYCVNLVRATRDAKGVGITSLVGMIDVPASPRATAPPVMATRGTAPAPAVPRRAARKPITAATPPDSYSLKSSTMSG